MMDNPFLFTSLTADMISKKGLGMNIKEKGMEHFIFRSNCSTDHQVKNWEGLRDYMIQTLA